MNRRETLRSSVQLETDRSELQELRDEIGALRDALRLALSTRPDMERALTELRMALDSMRSSSGTEVLEELASTASQSKAAAEDLREALRTAARVASTVDELRRYHRAYGWRTIAMSAVAGALAGPVSTSLVIAALVWGLL